MTRRAVFNEHGFMAYVSESYIAAAKKRGELCEDEEGVLWVVPQPMRELTPEEKRRIQLAKERSNR